MFSHTYFIQIAYQEALKAYDEQEIPVGALVVCGQQIIAKAYNQSERLHDVTAHAEMLAITAASNYLHAKYLPECTLYVTLEPCLMCAGALAWAQVGTLVYGAYDSKRGFSRLETNVLHPKTQVMGGVLEQECSDLIHDFFKKLR